MSGNPRQLDPNKITKPVDNTENQRDGHREIVFAVTPGEKQFWLKLQDSRHTWNNIPLGKVKSTAKGQYPKGSNVIVPVIPLSYTTPDNDPQQAAILRKGWLYVYCNGELWRELEVAGSGYLSDVNLQYNREKDERQATGHHDNRLLLLHKLMGEVQVTEIAFSEVQWSWARIKKLEEDAELRRQRMQEIDLSGYATKFEPLLPEGNKARVENVAQAPQLYHLALQRKSNIPVVYLHDPLGVAKSLAEGHETDWADMEILIESLRSGIRPTEIERSAALGKRAPKETFEEEKARQQIAAQFEVAVLMQQIGFASEQNQKAYGRHLNLEHLDTLLGTKERAKQREKILQSKDKLARFLDQDLYQTALEDYLENTPLRVIDGKGVVLYPARFLDRPPTTLDANLNRPEINHQSSADAGTAYVDKLREGGSTACKILEKEAEVSRTEWGKPGSASPNSVQILQDPASPLGQRLKVVVEDTKIDLATKTGTIGAALVETFASRTTEQKDTLEWLAGRINTIKAPDFPEFVVAEQTFPELELPEGYRPVDGGASFSLRETATAGTAAMHQASTVVYNSPGKYRTVVSGRSLRVLPVEYKKVDVVVHQIVSRQVKTNLARIAERFQTSIARAGATKPLFFALELVNLRSAWQQVLDDSRNLGTFSLKGINLAGAAASTAEQLAELNNLWLRMVGKEEAGALTRIARTGKFVGNAAAGIINLWDFGLNYIEKDKDASLAYFVGALAAFGALTVTGLGWTLLCVSGSIGSVIVASLLEDDPLERFATNGPLSQRAPSGSDIWEQIRIGSQTVAVTDHFAEEWSTWMTIREALIDDYLYAFQTDLWARRERVKLTVNDLNGDGRLDLQENVAGFLVNTMTEISAATSIQVRIILPQFAPFLSNMDFQCRYYPQGLSGPKVLLPKPAEIDHMVDEESGKVKTVHLNYRLDEEQVRQQTMTGEFLFFCRIQSSKHAGRYYPAQAEDGEFRYLVVRQAAMQIDGQDVTTRIRKIGTLDELERKEFWEVKS